MGMVQVGCCIRECLKNKWVCPQPIINQDRTAILVIAAAGVGQHAHR